MHNTEERAYLRPSTDLDEEQIDDLLPLHATVDSAGVDLRARIPAKLTIAEGTEARIPTGFGLRLPKGFCGLVLPRSSIKNGIIPNSPGLIDRDFFPNEIEVRIYALMGEVVIHPGDRIAQLVVTPYLGINGAQEGRQERTGGFGSTQELRGKSDEEAKLVIADEPSTEELQVLVAEGEKAAKPKPAPRKLPRSGGKKK